MPSSRKHRIPTAPAPILGLSYLLYPWSMGTLMCSFSRNRCTREFVWEMPLSYKNSQHRFWLLPKTLRNTWRDAQGLLHIQLRQGQPLQRGAGGKHPGLALEELTLQAENLRSNTVLKRVREERSPKGLPGLVASNKTALQTPSKGCLRFPTFSPPPSQQKPFTNIIQAAS